MHPKTVARHAALRALMALEREEISLQQALESQLDGNTSRAFARELTTQVCRHRGLLDWTLAPLLKKPLDKLDPAVRAALRLGAYETACSDTPSLVAAGEYAGLMRAERLKSAVGFVNAVVRRLPPQPRAAPEIAKDAAAHLAISYSHPLWLVRRWLARFGLEECRRLLEANNAIAPLSLRVNGRRATRAEVVRALQSRGFAARESSLSAAGVVVSEAGSPLDWPEWKAGQIIAQDEAAQLVARLASPQPGQRVFDVAAAPGGKATHLAELMDDNGIVLACDRAPGRLKLVTSNARRLGLNSVQTRAGDWRELAPELAQEPADVLLLDAPCLGTGTLRRRPDAKWKKTPEQLAQLVNLQRELLDAAALAVAPGGTLIYATCSLEPEENEQQVAAFLDRNQHFSLLAPNAEFPDSVQRDGAIQTLPQRHNCDGMFAAKLRRS